MKRMKMLPVAATLILSLICATGLRAQENLEKMIEKLMASNTTTQIINYNGRDKSLPTYTAKITIFDKPLLDEFIAAFNRDKGSANLSGIISKENPAPSDSGWNPAGGDKVTTSAIFNRDGMSHMYSYFVANPSNGLVIYSKYRDMNPAMESVSKFTADSLRAELKTQLAFKPAMDGPGKKETAGNDILAAIPFRIEIPGKSVITDGVNFIRSEKLKFGSADRVPVKTDRKITILIPEKDFIYVNGMKCTAAQARAKGLNVVTF